MGLRTAIPHITVHGIFFIFLLFFFIFYFWVFLQNYSFATTLSNSVYRTTLMFFDVPDSFLMLF